MPSEQTFYCRISGRRFRLYVLGPGRLFNMMMPFFFGTVNDSPDGSIIRGRLGVHPLTFVMLLGYLALATSMIVFIVGAAVTGWVPFTVHRAILVLVPAVFAAVGVALFKFGIMLGHEQEKAILRFLATKLEAMRAMTGERS